MIKENRLDVDKKQLNILKAIIKQHISDKTVWVYDSRATWKASETSDLDLTVFDCTDSQTYDLKEALEESDLLFSVDVMNWEEIPENFRTNIKKKYVVLQEKKELEGWREVRLGDVAEVIMGQSPKSETYNENGEGLPFYQGIVDFGDRFTISRVYCSDPKKVIEAGDILLSVRAPVGKVNFTKERCSIGRGNAGLRMKSGTQNFLFYLLKFSENQFHSNSSGSIFSSINKSNIENLEIALPPLSEQKAIAEILSSLDDKIDLLHRQNKTLEDIAQTLFRKWFIDESQEDWEIGKIPDEFDFTMGQSPPGKSYNAEQNGTPMFQGNADFGFRFPKNRIYTTQPKRFAEKYDTLISVRAPVGEQNMAKEKCCIGRGVATFRYKNNKSFYTYTYFKMMSLLREIKQYNHTGTVFGSISKSDFQSIEIMIPPISLIEKFQETAKPIDDKIISNQTQISTLENLRDTLLPKLMSGTVRVANNG